MHWVKKDNGTNNEVGLTGDGEEEDNGDVGIPEVDLPGDEGYEAGMGRGTYRDVMMDILGGDLTTFPPKEVGDNDAEDRTNGGDCEGSGNNHDVERGNESNDGNLGSDSDKDDGGRRSLNMRGGKRGGYPMSVNVQRR